MSKTKKIIIPDLTEFTDDEGNIWVQTSTDDLLSSRELNDILESIEKDTTPDEIVLARIDFQRVNKKYYEEIIELQAKLKKRDEIIKKIIIESKKAFEKKNNKLKELIDYIKELHLLLSYYKVNPENIVETGVPLKTLLELQSQRDNKKEKKPENENIDEETGVFTEVEEILLDESGEESGLANN